MYVRLSVYVRMYDVWVVCDSQDVNGKARRTGSRWPDGASFGQTPNRGPPATSSVGGVSGCVGLTWSCWGVAYQMR